MKNVKASFFTQYFCITPKGGYKSTLHTAYAGRRDMYEHGGDIYRNKIKYDFSVNLSPYGIPPMVRAALSESLLFAGNYPDALYKNTREVIAGLEGVKSEEVICGNGASELLYVTLRGIKKLCGNNKVTVGLINPCFSEYKKAALAADLENFYELSLNSDEDFELTKEQFDDLFFNSNLIILGNPNNPTGKLINSDWLEEAYEYIEKENKFLILDESFLALTERFEKYKHKALNNLVVIKSFTKSMAIPGIRAGYMFSGNSKLINIINSLLPEWNMSVPAVFASEASAKCYCLLKEQLLDEEAGIKKLREGLKEELIKRGIKVYSSDTVFLLLRSEKPLYDLLLKEGILIRDCKNFDGLGEGFYRVAVKTEEENLCLLKGLDKALETINISEEKDDEQDFREASSNANQHKLLHVKPEDIEATSFKLLTDELKAKGIVLKGDTAPVIKRCIHTTADFEYVNTLVFSEDVISKAKDLISLGAHLVTDTNMALSGINKKELAKYGGEAHCFMADSEIAKKAKERGVTRATMSMEHAATLNQKQIFVVGNAPTALITLCDLIDSGRYLPDMVIGVPVGFVNVEQAKELLMKRKVPFIVNRGRKGGSNVAAAIVNAILYEMREEANG